MRLGSAIYIFIFYAMTLAITANAKDPCEVERVEFHNAELLKLSCQVQDIAAAILEEQSVVPSKIYHFGKKVHLEEDVAIKTIPEKVWNTFIMGDKTRFGLSKARRGLYGTSGVDTNAFGGDEYNWLMQISIKEECRHPSKVGDIQNLAKNDHFKKWMSLKTRSMNIENYQKQCALNDYEGFSSKECDELVTLYLDESDVKVVLDHSIKKSFFIRDRSCIEDIKGSANDWIEILAKQSALWVKRCQSFGDSGIDHLVGILLQSMSEAKTTVSKNSEAQILQNLKSSNNTFNSLIQTAITANNRCVKKKSDDFATTVKTKALSFIDMIYLAPIENDLKKICL